MHALLELRIEIGLERDAEAGSFFWSEIISSLVHCDFIIERHGGLLRLESKCGCDEISYGPSFHLPWGTWAVLLESLGNEEMLGEACLLSPAH